MNYCGIYKITQKSTGKIYIGQSINVTRRIEEHFNCKNDDWHKLLYNNPFDWSVEYIEQCAPEELDERERYWINYYNSDSNGFNKTSGNHCNNDNKEIPFKVCWNFFNNNDTQRVLKACSSKSFQKTLNQIAENKKFDLKNDELLAFFCYSQPNIDLFGIKLYLVDKSGLIKTMIVLILDLNKTYPDRYDVEEFMSNFSYFEYDRIGHSCYYIRNIGGYQIINFPGI